MSVAKRRATKKRRVENRSCRAREERASERYRARERASEREASSSERARSEQLSIVSIIYLLSIYLSIYISIYLSIYHIMPCRQCKWFLPNNTVLPMQHLAKSILQRRAVWLEKALFTATFEYKLWWTTQQQHHVWLTI